MYSLSGRLLLWVSGLLVIFFGLTGLGLDLAFRNASERAVRELLEVRVIMLLGAAEPENGTLALTGDLPDPRFAQPGSGLYASLQDRQGTVLWRSPSSTGTEIPAGTVPAAGQRNYRQAQASDGTPVLALSYGIEWEFDDGRLEPFSVHVAESLDAYYAQVGRFRRQLGSWFAGVLVLLLFSVAVLMRFLLRPLSRVEEEIRKVEHGEAEVLGEGYPRELAGVTRNMNGLILSERQRLERYRNALGDLAHSLKTPLAVVRGQLDAGPTMDPALVGQQVERMDEIIRYQLQRASAAGASGLGRGRIEVEQVVHSLASALDKVYADKHPACEFDLQHEACFRGDRSDLMEMVGNLLDNAYKYCRSKVIISCRPIASPNSSGGALEIRVEDDGKGFPDGVEQTLLQRGVRADELADGQGIGLAVVKDIAESYQGALTLTRSSLGGACIVLQLPAA